MKVSVEFIAGMREKAGVREVAIESEEEVTEMTVHRLLAAVEERFGKETLPLFEGTNVKKGVLLFRKQENQSLHRISDVTTMVEDGDVIVLTTGMVGG
jgi:molybdopterin converting factor small subunit